MNAMPYENPAFITDAPLRHPRCRDRRRDPDQRSFGRSVHPAPPKNQPPDASADGARTASSHHPVKTILRKSLSGIFATWLIFSPLALLGQQTDPAPAVEATPAPKETKKEKAHGLSTQFDDDSSSVLTPELRSKLTPEQIYNLELARLEKGRNHGADVEDVLVPLGCFAMIVGIVGLVVWNSTRSRRMLHETLRLMVEKGQPIPEELLRGTLNKPLRSPKSDLRRGLVCLALGLGFLVFFLVDHNHAWGLALIPICLGLGYLVAWRLESKPVPGNGN